MAKQTFTTGQVLTAAQMTSLQQTAMGGGSATAKTASYTLVAADAGATVIMNSASATTITVNTSLFSAGDTVFIQNIGAGVSTITAGTATVNTASSLALAQYESGTLYFTAAGASIFSKADGAGAAAGGMTLLQSLTLSGSSTTSTTLSCSYKMLRCIYYEVLGTDAYNAMTIGLRVNSDSSNIYATVGVDTYGTAGFFTAYNTAQIELNTIAYASNTKESSGIIEIPNYANGSSDAKTVTFAFAKQDDRIGNGSGRITLTNAITTLTFRHIQSGGSFTAGTVDIYGVN